MREYTESHYLPGAEAYAARAANGGKLGQEIALWQEKLAASWGSVHFGELRIQRRDDGLYFEVGVHLADLAGLIRVEIFADGRGSDPPFRREMTPGHQADGWCVFSASLPATRNAADYTVRIVPHHPAALVPLEAHQILWQK